MAINSILGKPTDHHSLDRLNMINDFLIKKKPTSSAIRSIAGWDADPNRLLVRSLTYSAIRSLAGWDADPFNNQVNFRLGHWPIRQLNRLLVGMLAHSAIK